MSFINYYVLLCAKHVKSIFFVFCTQYIYNSDVEVMLHIANLITFVRTKTHSR